MSNHSLLVLRITAVTLSALLLSGCGGSPPIETNEAVVMEIREQIESGVSVGGGETVVADPVGWGTIRGVVKLASEAPEREPLALSGDDAPKCSADGELLSQEVVAGSNGELKNVLLIISSDVPVDKDGWVHPDYANPVDLLSGDMGFDQENCVFQSHLYAFREGQTVQIINSDPMGHNTNISGGEGKGGSAARAFNQLVAAGATSEYDPGGSCNLPMTVTCNIHPWMKAYMMVSPHPYFDVTGDDGSFELKNVPAGVELELRAWHEARVDVSDGDGGWRRGRRAITLEDGQTIDLQITAALD